MEIKLIRNIQIHFIAVTLMLLVTTYLAFELFFFSDGIWGVELLALLVPTWVAGLWSMLGDLEVHNLKLTDLLRLK